MHVRIIDLASIICGVSIGYPLFSCITIDSSFFRFLHPIRCVARFVEHPFTVCVHKTGPAVLFWPARDPSVVSSRSAGQSCGRLRMVVRSTLLRFGWHANVWHRSCRSVCGGACHIFPPSFATAIVFGFPPETIFFLFFHSGAIEREREREREIRSIICDCV